MEIAALLDLHTKPTTAVVFPGRRRARHAARAALAFVFSTAIAFGMSMQFLAQLFVWRNWPISEVLRGRLYIFRDRLIVATLVTVPIVMLGVLRTQSTLLRSALLAAGILGGAVATAYHLWRASADSGKRLRLESLRRQSVATLVENAMKHGLTPPPSGGTISITASSHYGQLEVVVADNGVGLQVDSGGGTGIGLYNVRARLATLYGAKAALQVQANQTTGVCATIRLPLAERAG